MMDCITRASPEENAPLGCGGAQKTENTGRNAMLTRRTALGGLLGFGAGLGFAPQGGHAQSFPAKPITIIVPYPAGGPVDAVARLYADEAAGDLGQPVTVD